ERVIHRLPEQPIFRPGWTTDLMHFAMSHLMVQVTVVLTMLPAALLFRWATQPWLPGPGAAQPLALALQFLEIILVADFTQYWVHRAFHRVPWLWRLHAIHHSSESMDWLAGSRLHLIDIVVTRGLSFVPLYVLGFAPPAVYAYLVFVSFLAVFIHANVRATWERSTGWWPRRVFTTGTMPRPRWTRTSPCICRGSIGSSARPICQRDAGPRSTASRGDRCRRAIGASSPGRCYRIRRGRAATSGRRAARAGRGRLGARTRSRSPTARSSRRPP